MKNNVDKNISKVISTHRKKLKNLTKNAELPFSPSETVNNLSSCKLTDDELELLKNGLGFSIKPPHLNKTNILASFEKIHYTMKNKLIDKNSATHLKTEIAHLAQNYLSSYRPSSNDLKKHRILRTLRNNHNIIILKPDKGNGVVILDRTVYLDSCFNILNDKTKFKLLDNDPTLLREGRLKRFITQLKKKRSIDDDTYCNIFPKGSQPAKFYGLPKLHKKRDNHRQPPLRPIVSSIGAYNYNLAKYLSSLLVPLLPDKYSVKDSFSFVEELRSFDFNNKFLISFDVESLFTNIPLNETIDIAVDLILKHHPKFSIKKPDLKKLFSFATSETHFLFNGKFYDQVDGVAMGSPLAPILANLFLGFHEETWLNNFNKADILLYRRYVDDTFCVFKNERDAMSFFEFINSQHPNIKFTFEKQNDGKLSFLDVLIDNSSHDCVFSVFHKKTYTGLLTNFFSFTPFRYKIGLVRTLIDRTYKINNTSSGFENDLIKLSDTLKRNSFPSHIIEKTFKRYLNKPSDQKSRNVNDENNIRYFKLPFIGQYSRITELKLRQLLKRFCETDLNIKLVFTSFKIKNMFSFKDRTPDALKSMVVYQFTCAGCNSCYIGETSRHFSTRIKEHTVSDKNSHIFKHLSQFSSCRGMYTPSCFRILDSANSSIDLKLKEAFYISKNKPDLNKQLHHFNTFLTL